MCWLLGPQPGVSSWRFVRDSGLLVLCALRNLRNTAQELLLLGHSTKM